MQSVECPICWAVKGAPCQNAYGLVYEGKGHSDRRNQYYIWRKAQRQAAGKRKR